MKKILWVIFGAILAWITRNLYQKKLLKDFEADGEKMRTLWYR